MSITNIPIKRGEFQGARVLHTSKAYLKQEVYFYALIRSEKFKKLITKIRKKHKMPPQGFKDDEEWGRWLVKYSAKDNITVHFKVLGDVEKICSEFGINYAEFQEMIMPIVYHNDAQELPLYKNRFALCHIVEIKDLYENALKKRYAESRPIAILVSPDAGLNDIVSYVKTVYTMDIAPLQARYQNPKSKINLPNSKNPRFKYRDPKSERMYDFVYDNRNLSDKKWAAVLADERATITDVKEKRLYEIDKWLRKKIIAYEKKRRKDVWYT